MHSTSQSAIRRPLGEATRRVNNSQQQCQPRYSDKAPAIPPYESQGTNHLIQGEATDNYHLAPPLQVSEFLNVVNPRVSAIAKEHPVSNRNSQISTTSTNSEGKRLKSFIGPWKLGKTLGKGATARVRLARHAVTGQEAAVKIVQKKNAQLSQAGSLAELDKAESKLLDSEDGLRRMPIGIEREVAIMKLIQHPNIMKLHDIWENRTEM
jgi:serine/threonine-protein kinase HSL1 (negative regulator of Swe1 kinase)